MKADIEDPCWTAYTLGELSKEDMQEAEVLLSENPELASHVSTLQETLKFLQEELGKVPPVQLEPLRREAVLQEASPSKISTKRFWIPTAAAALFAIGFGIAHWRSLPQESPKVLGEDLAPMEIRMNSDKALPSPSLRMEAPMSAPVIEEAPAKQKKMEPSRERKLKSDIEGTSFSRQESVGDFSTGGLESKTERDELNEEALPLPTPTPTPTPEPEKTTERPARRSLGGF